MIDLKDFKDSLERLLTFVPVNPDSTQFLSELLIDDEGCEVRVYIPVIPKDPSLAEKRCIMSPSRLSSYVRLPISGVLIPMEVAEAGEFGYLTDLPDKIDIIIDTGIDIPGIILEEVSCPYCRTEDNIEIVTEGILSLGQCNNTDCRKTFFYNGGSVGLKLEKLSKAKLLEHAKDFGIQSFDLEGSYARIKELDLAQEE
jgi:hypothetical protein